MKKQIQIQAAELLVPDYAKKRAIPDAVMVVLVLQKKSQSLVLLDVLLNVQAIVEMTVLLLAEKDVQIVVIVVAQVVVLEVAQVLAVFLYALIAAAVLVELIVVVVVLMLALDVQELVQDALGRVLQVVVKPVTERPKLRLLQPVPMDVRTDAYRIALMDVLI